MVEIQLKDLSPKSQRSRFAPVIFAEANALAKKDEALKLFVRGVKEHIRAYDEIGRYGGDEFIVVRKNGPLRADRLVEDISESFGQLEAPYNRLGATVGVADFSKDTGTISAEELVHRADQAFYYAKEKNIDTPVIWESSMVSIVDPK